MFRIRSVPDDTSPANAAALAGVQSVLRAQFEGIDESEVASLRAKLRDPLSYRFRTVLLVAEDARADLRGFALFSHVAELRFTYLDYVAVVPGRPGGGVGGALYQRVREESVALEAEVLLFECLPDDPELCADEAARRQNAERLKFYERYGARPLANTAYETPVEPGGDSPPYLCVDALGHTRLPSRDAMRGFVRCILERKYAALCPPEYIERVVASVQEDPVTLRPRRYVRRRRSVPVAPERRLDARIALVVNAGHDIHHVRERGYVEAPVRIASIERQIEESGLFAPVAPKRFPDSHVTAVHDPDLVDYIRRACALAGPSSSFYPYVFPIRNAARPPRELPLRAGYWCVDTFTPLNENAWRAARGAVDCALTAAERVLEGQALAYALVRPPGHHAERRAFGGFCYLNNAAVAAHFLSRYGRVAVLDIDYHHGNGTQHIFYQRDDVLTVSIHGHPRIAYPYFSGHAGEIGEGAGTGFNLNIPLPEAQTPEQYREALARALARIERHRPAYLVLSAGFDTAAGDPTGSWRNRAEDFARIGAAIGGLGLPTVVVQEGGYRIRTLGTNVRRFFEGLAAAHAGAAPAPRRPAPPAPRRRGLVLRESLTAEDLESVRSLTAAAGVFSSEEVSIAVEVAAERLARGAASGYEFIFALRDGRVVGYLCYGPIPGAERRYDLYWLVVDPECQRAGIAQALVARCEQAVAKRGGVRIYVDTAGGDAYGPARRFYAAAGFEKVAELPDFYSNGDTRVIFAKASAPAAAPARASSAAN